MKGQHGNECETPWLETCTAYCEDMGTEIRHTLKCENARRALAGGKLKQLGITTFSGERY